MRIVGLVSLVILGILSCRRAPDPSPAGGYPAAVSKIIVSKCATSGCHNQETGAAGLQLDAWEHMFNGSKNGAVTIAYSPECSPLLYYINNDSTRGLCRSHGSGANAQPLTAAEYTTLRDWIANGAPDEHGNIPFAAKQATSQKIYIAHGAGGACKKLAVIDAERHVVTSYVNIGSAGNESVHNIRVSPDGKYAYICFLNGSFIQKIDCATDKVIGQINIPAGRQWGVINISPDGRKLMIDDWQSDGELYVINTETMSIMQTFNGSGMFIYPHGIASNATFDTFYVTSLFGNVLYKFSLDGSFYKKISIDGQPLVNSSLASTPDPHDIAFTPDYSRYMITCQKSNQVRVFDAHSDSLIAVLPVGMMPQHIAVSKRTDYAVVACMDDMMGGMHNMGSVWVINYKTLQVVKTIYGDFYEPHCILVDDPSGTFYVLNKNLTPGFMGSHPSVCGPQNGWYNVYSLSTLMPLTGRIETLSNPYFGDARYK